MNFKKAFKEAKNLSVQYFAEQLGLQEVQKKNGGRDLWYLSPDGENTASLHVNTADNVWYNWSNGEKGDVVDLVIYVNKTKGITMDYKEALLYLFDYKENNDVKIIQPEPKSKTVSYVNEFKSSSNKFSKGQIDLLRERNISLDVANKYLRNITFFSNKMGRNFSGLGFINRSGGWEIRNKYKTSVGKKDITIIEGENSSIVEVFESWRDFLPYLSVLYPNQEKPPFTVVILNSLSFHGIVYTMILKRLNSGKNNLVEIRTFFHNDVRKNPDKLTASEKATELFLTLPVMVNPMNFYYRDFNDPGEYFQ